jgi:hypothetical protein
MRTTRWVALTVLIVAGMLTGSLVAAPELVRRVAIARIQAITHRQVHIDRVALNVFTGRLAVYGFRVADRAPGPDLADFEELDLRVSPFSLLRGHLWVRDAVLRAPRVRIVRHPDGFNVSDLVLGSGAAAGSLDATVDRFALIGGTVTLEDRALAVPQTWTSQNIRVEARNVSTRDEQGVAEGSSVTAGASVSVKFTQFRLYPIHLDGVVTVNGLDLSVARLYFPPDSKAVVKDGRASTFLHLVLDAKAGVRAEASGQIENLALVDPKTGERFLVVPKMKSQLSDFAFNDGQLAVGRFELTGSASALDPIARGGPRFETSTVRASIADLTWPVRTAARVEVQTSVPGGGTGTLTGAVRPPPAASQLSLRLVNVNLAPWARFLRTSAQIIGTAESDLRIDEPLAAGVPAHVRGSIAVNDVGVRDAGQQVLGVRRVEASGLDVHWPARLTVKRLSITGPRGVVERDKVGKLSLARLLSASAATLPKTPAARTGPARPSSATSPGVSIGEVVVREGELAWRDAAVSPAAALDFSGINARVTGITWPLGREPLGIQGTVRPPGGGQFDVRGRVSVDPVGGDLRIAASDASLAPYGPYLPTAAHIQGWADLDLAVHLPRTAEERLTARGSAALSRVDVRDEQRSVVRLERGVATDLHVVWPQRVVVQELALRRPWVLVERDQRGALTLLNLLPAAPEKNKTPTKPAAPEKNEAAAGADAGNGAIALAVRQLVIDEGGARVVDRSISPPFAVDVSRLDLNADGVATAPAKPARFSLKGRIGATSLLDLNGTISPLGGPLHLDVSGDLQGLWMPRTDPYLLRYVGWEAHGGFLTTNIRCRLDRDALDAQTDITLRRLDVARGSKDETQRHIGLPIGLIVALMKDARGDIHVSLPVGGRLSDPHFDFSEAIWSSIKNVVFKAITLPISWIGRVQYTPDLRIERIDVDPVRFRAGTAEPTAEGVTQVSRLAAFLQQAPSTRLALTPMVSRDDLAALKRRALDAEIGRVAQEKQISADDAARRLYGQRFPNQTPPGTSDAIDAALMEAEPLPASAASEMAAQRLDAVRTMARKSGVDTGRFVERKPIEGPNARDSQVALDVTAPEEPEHSGPRWSDFLHRLGRATSNSEPARE